MKDFLKRVIEGTGIPPSEACLQSLNDNFNEAFNVEWFSKEGYFEAIFYRHNLEHIALFSLDGALLEYKQNIPAEQLPEYIRSTVLSKGEIMNSVQKNKGNIIEYEFIVRDKLLKRYLIILSDMGEIKEEKIL